MAKFIYEGRTHEQFTGHEKIARRNIYHAFNWIVGGYYNAIQDDDTDILPKSRKDLADEIYDSAMTNWYDVGMESFGRAPKEMRFAGEKFCRTYIDWKLNKDEDVAEIARVANW